MSKISLRRLLVTSLCFLWTGIVHAQAACPPGQIPYGSGNGLNMCGPDNRQQSAPQPPAPQWESRWGAIATDGKQWAMGVAVGKQSKLEASKTAMADCHSKGGANCKVDVAYGNQCAAVVAGDGGYNVSPASTVDEAVAIGVKTCTETGDTNCRTYYTTCSLPVRIR
ncbi:DUF4189 domain-containing protein [Variovorax sp. LT1R16]|uniref:DUF4189 domain-containing protein n=1 Tax=Variovorax sp. LT1R16 TaxID=3443728 RepID=UPI003F4871CA